MGLDKKTVLNHEVQRQTSLFVLSDRKSLVYRRASKVPGTSFRDEATLLVKEEIPLLYTANDNGALRSRKLQEQALPHGGTLGFIYEMDLDDANESLYHQKGVDGVRLDNTEDFKSAILDSSFGEERKLESPGKSPSKTKKKNIFPKSANSFYWKTTQDRVQQAVDYGITQYEALTSKVIGAVGAYRLKVFERAYDFGIISDKYEEKEFLLRITQTRIRHMQGLERLTNAYDQYSDAETNKQRIEATFKDYIDALKQLQIDIKDHSFSLNKFDREASQKLISQIQDDIKAAKEYQSCILECPLPECSLQDHLKDTILLASGPDSIAHFIKNRMIYALRQAQEHNQNTTYSRKAGSIFRGEFNSYCEDALKVINNYLCDHHNPVTPEHQGYFSTNPKHSLTLDFRHLGKNRQTVRRYIMAITQIEGADKIQCDSGDEYVLQCANSNNPHAKHLKVTRLTNWDIQASKSYPFYRIAYWIWNLCVGIVFGLIDLPAGFISGLKGEEPTSKVSQYTKEFTPDCAKDTRFHALAEKINFPAVSLGAKLGSLIGSVIRNTIWEVFKGVRTSFQRARFQMGENLVTDFDIFHNGLRSEAAIFKQVRDDLNQMKLQEEELFNKINNKHKKHWDQKPVFSSKDGSKELERITPEEISGQLAQASNELNPGEWHDLLNAALGGFIFLFDFVFDEIHAKHPGSGIIYNGFYILGMIAVLSPQTLEFLGKNYIQISRSISDAATSNLTAGASFCASVEAQAAAMATEFGVSGRNSWLLTGLSSLEEEPSNMIAYSAIAVGLGAILAYGLNVPYISESIRGELGSVPAIALGVAGAKFGLCLFELFQTEASEEKKETDARREKLKLLLIEHFQEKYQLTDQKIDEICNFMLSSDFKKSLEAVSADKDSGLQRFQLFMLIQKHQHLLPHLPYSTKRELLELMHRNSEAIPGGEAAMHQLLFPETKGSIIEITVSTVLDYIPAIGGCAASIVTWDAHPWRYLGNKLLKDVGRVFHAFANKIIKTIAHYIRLNVRIIFDVIFNEIFARIEGFIRNDQHLLSSGHYSFSTDVDTSFETAKEFFAQPVDAMRKAVTQPSPQTFFAENMQQISNDCIKGFQENSTEASPSVAAKTTIEASPQKSKKRKPEDSSLFEINIYPAIRFFSPSTSNREKVGSSSSEAQKHKTARAIDFN
ncbi:MAG: hypothetical protein K2X50_03520 [Gammaproteobacteria bacterium]|nr:hypothetical protein [Gammaproteobacteria bacterium]